MRDYRKLRAFQLADQFAVDVYRTTAAFPKDEQYNITRQLRRRAAVSVPSNIVEGSAKRSTREYLHFLDTAFGSACELHDQLGLAVRLELLDANAPVIASAQECCRTLNALVNAIARRSTQGDNNGE